MQLTPCSSRGEIRRRSEWLAETIAGKDHIPVASSCIWISQHLAIHTWQGKVKEGKVKVRRVMGRSRRR